MIKNIISSAVFLSLIFAVVPNGLSAQESEIAPAKGDFMVSVNFGVGSYIGGWKTPTPNQKSYTLSAPMENWFDKKPMLDLEARCFVTNSWAIKASLGFAYNYNPGYSEVTGTTEGEGLIGSDDVEIPTYNAVPNSSNTQFSMTIGSDGYWKLMEQFFFHFGGDFNIAYGRAQAIGNDSEDYMGKSIAEAYAFRLAPVMGVDYFFNKVLFVGAEVRPIAYQYAVYKERPQAGLGLLSSDSYTFSFFAQPMIKLGFRF